jgi:benzil reductase ((S)-benzoin forming)
MNFLITGHSSGLGKALTILLLKKNHSVYGISRSKSNLLIEEIVCDLSDLDSVKTRACKFVESITRIDYAFLNAGTLGEIKKAKDVSIESFSSSIQINVFSNKLLIDTLLSMKNPCKNIITISSGAALSPKDGWFEYCITKSSLKMMTEQYAIENQETKFISLAPGVIKTKMQDSILLADPSKFKSVKKFHDMYDSLPSPEDISKNILDFIEHNIDDVKSGDYFDLRQIND